MKMFEKLRNWELNYRKNYPRQNLFFFYLCCFIVYIKAKLCSMIFGGGILLYYKAGPLHVFQQKYT